MVKQAPKIRFNFYNVKIDICVFIFIKISHEYYHEISQINTANVGVNPQTSLGSTALGFMWINTSVLGIHFFFLMIQANQRRNCLSLVWQFSLTKYRGSRISVVISV